MARSAGALMFESNVRCSFFTDTSKTKTITEKLYGFKLVSDSEVVSQDSVAVGFDCGAPPEPMVHKIYLHYFCVYKR